MSNLTLKAAFQAVAAFAEAKGYKPVTQDKFLSFDDNLLDAILKTRNESLIAAACMLVDQEVRAIPCAS